MILGSDMMNVSKAVVEKFMAWQIEVIGAGVDGKRP
jgi:hypothetical protein